MISPLSFKAKIYVDNSQLHTKDAITLWQPLAQHTRVNRLGLNESLDVITSSFPDKLDPTKPPPKKPMKFFVYGCSSGLESYSIILYLIKKYGSLKEAQKRVEIQSIDIPSPALNMAKSGNLHLDFIDFDKFQGIRNSMFSLKTIDIAKFYQSSCPAYKVHRKMFNYANFKEGRILEDFARKGSFNEKEPVALFFRSALPYIRPELAFTLIDNMYKKLPNGSFLCLGDYDLDNDGWEQYDKVSKTFEPIITEDESSGIRPYLFRKTAAGGVK